VRLAAQLRRSNASLFREACQRPGSHRTPGPTPFQGNLAANNKLDDLFVGNYLREERLTSFPHATCDLVRDLPTGRMFRMRSYSPELSLDADGYRAVSKSVLSISHSRVIQPTEIFDHGKRLHVLRPHLVGESFLQLVERLGPLPKDAATRLAIQLLQLLAELGAHRVIGIRPSQIILTPDDQITLVDLDETETLFFKRQLRLKTTNASVFVGKDRTFIAPEVFNEGKFDSQRAILYSVGQNLRYLLTGQWPDMSQAQGGTSWAQGHLRDVLHELTDLDPASRIGSCQEALRQLRLSIQSDAAAQPSLVAVPRHHDVSDRPPIRTSSLLRQTALLGMMVAVPAFVGFGIFQAFANRSSTAAQVLDAQEESRIINSDEEFQIP
jgi:hypothetical protein